MVGNCELNASNSGQEPVAGPYEQGVPYKAGNFKESAP
jgi:hypothetical protein